MTGPAPGKLELKGAKVTLVSGGWRKTLADAVVYIHLKGYARARVTHLDVEHPDLEAFVKASGFRRIRGVAGGGVEIALGENRKVVVKHILLVKILPREASTYAYVGVKEGGIYIGFRRDEVRKLEEIALIHFNLSPA